MNKDLIFGLLSFSSGGTILMFVLFLVTDDWMNIVLSIIIYSLAGFTLFGLGLYVLIKNAITESKT